MTAAAAASQSSSVARIRPEIKFVTSSARKFHEANAIVGEDAPFTLVRHAVDLPELQGEPEDIILAKCRDAVSIVGGPVICEDVSLQFHALNGLPGPYIKWFMGRIGPRGLNNLLAAYEDKRAVAVCTVAFARNAESGPAIFSGTCEGVIVEPRGDEGSFCWDAIFQPTGHSQTFAEMDSATKNAISHRARAFATLKLFIADYLERRRKRCPGCGEVIPTN